VLINGATTAATGAVTASLPTAVTTGSVTLNNASGPQVTTTGTTSNFILIGATGQEAPAFTTRSAGTKVVYRSAVSGTTADYARGTGIGFLWDSVPSSGNDFRWYAGITQIAGMTGLGSFSVLGDNSGDTLTSSVSDGTTAPITVSNQVICPNLNADMVDNCHIIQSTTAPTISTNPGLGTGFTHVANWMYIGPVATGAVGTLHLQGTITLGVGPTMGDLRITLPGSYTFAQFVTGSFGRCGIAGYNAAGVGYTGAMRMESSTVARFIVMNTSTTSNQDAALTSTLPGTWVVGNTIQYEIHCLVVAP
jgi:hypothetical protein